LIFAQKAATRPAIVQERNDKKKMHDEVLVGGSTLLPKVQSMTLELF
jgi:hypothetical protein